MGSWFEANGPLGTDWHLEDDDTKRLPSLMVSDSAILSLFDAPACLGTDKIFPEETIENGIKCIGASHGWLFMTDSASKIFLLNPLTRSRIRLPSIARHLHKAILSSDPKKAYSESIAMIIFGKKRQLAICKRGDKSWRIVRTGGCFYDDVIYCSGKFFAVDDYGRVVMIENFIGSPKVTEITPRWFFRGDKVYLSATPWGLWLIIRHLDKCSGPVNGRTSDFEVYQLDPFDYSWCRVGDLGDRMLFLGQNHTVSLKTCGESELAKNCIFFSDHYVDENVQGRGRVIGCDVGTFKMDDQSISRVPLHQVDSCSTSLIPTWVMF